MAATTMDSENFELEPKVRVGIKREFEFALKSQAEISGSIDLTRCGQNQNAIQISECLTNNKRSRKSGSTKNENVNAAEIGDDAKNEIKAKSVITTATTTPTQVRKSKVASSNSKKFPTKLDDLMNSGILDGFHVKYIRSAKVQRHGETALKGVIRGNGIMCHCQTCKGVDVVVPTKFEEHAGSSNRRPSEYIFLENGLSLRRLMNTFLTSPLHNLEEDVQKAIGDLSLKKSKLCLNCRGVNIIFGLLCDTCVQEAKEAQHSPTHETSDRSPEALVPSNPLNNEIKQSASGDKSHRRVARKDHSLHKLVFQVLAEDTKLAYVVSGQKILTGYKEGLAIHCNCCHTKVSPSQFESHAGYASRRKSYLHIYTSEGVSLHLLSRRYASKNNTFSTTDKDELCNDGGDLLSCENTIQEEKYVENNKNVVAAERIDGVDSLEINQRCVCNELGGCALCRMTDFSKVFGPRTVMICDQCEREYHVGCLKEHDIETLKELPEGNWFCCSNCDHIHTTLQDLVANREKHLPNSLLNLIKKKNEKKGLGAEFGFDIKWRVLNKKLIASDDHKAEQLLSKALAIFHERFDPIIDPTSGKDFIKEMLEGGSIDPQVFTGMYCAVLTVNQEVVCAGIFRIFGQEVAELPLVATHKDWEGQGYFRCLFSLIERVLESLKVKEFLLPAADKAKSMWTSNFGFKDLDTNEMTSYRTLYNIVMFHETSLLKKPVPAS